MSSGFAGADGVRGHARRLQRRRTIAIDCRPRRIQAGQDAEHPRQEEAGEESSGDRRHREEETASSSLQDQLEVHAKAQTDDRGLKEEFRRSRVEAGIGVSGREADGETQGQGERGRCPGGETEEEDRAKEENLKGARHGGGL